MERKFGRYAIHNLSTYIIGAYVIGYFLYFLAPGVLYNYLSLEPYYILRGQIWRLITWVLIPPESPGIFTIIMLMLYYSLGNSLEQTWGAFRYNAYIFSGIISTIIGAFILYAVMGGNIVFGHTDQGQMVWDSLRSFHCPFLPSDKLGWKSGDHCIHVQFHPVFPDDEKLQQGFTKRNPSEAKFQKADQSVRQIRYYQAQVCDLRQNRAGR